MMIDMQYFNYHTKANVKELIKKVLPTYKIIEKCYLAVKDN